MFCRVPDEIADTMQTNGVELDEIPYGKCTLKIREVGGAFVEVCARIGGIPRTEERGPGRGLVVAGLKRGTFRVGFQHPL